MASRESLPGVRQVFRRRNCGNHVQPSSVRCGEISSVEHPGAKTECRQVFLNCLFDPANAHVEGEAVGNRSHAHNHSAKFAAAGPRRGSRICKRDIQMISKLVFAVTAKTHAVRRKVDGHGFFKPGNPSWTHANGEGKHTPGTAASLRFATVAVAIRNGVRMLFKMEGDCEACRSIGSAGCANGLIQLHGALLLRGALRLNFFARVHAANDFQPSPTPTTP